MRTPVRLVKFDIWLPCGCCQPTHIWKTGRLTDRAILTKKSFEHSCQAHRHFPDYEISIAGHVTQAMMTKLRQLELFTFEEAS